MKKALLTLFVGTTQAAAAQPLPMTFTAFNAEVYAPLSNPISLTNGEIWDDPEYTVPIGFPFQLFGNNVPELALLDVGGIVGYISPEMTLDGFLVYGSDIMDVGNVAMEVGMSPISYQVEGTTPNRIFKMEWTNVGFYYEIIDFGTANNTTNFQLWLYETTNVVEYRFGPNTITQPEIVHDFLLPMSGILKNLNLISGTADGAWFLGGNSANPTPTFFNIMTKEQPGPQHVLSGEPANGQVYRFAPIIPQSVSENAKASLFSVYPTLFDSQFNVRLDEGNNMPFILRNLLGQEVMTGRLNNGLNTFDGSALTSGVYLLTAGGTTVRLIKK